MAYHPANLAVRFVLELASWGAMAYWGLQQGQGVQRFVFAVGVPLIAIALWGTFAVPGDKSRSGKAPVPVPGAVRLLLEIANFGFATWALLNAGLPVLAFIFGVVAVLHYALSFDRIAWLLRQRQPATD